MTPDPTEDPAPLLPGAERLCASVHHVCVLLALALGGSNLAFWIMGSVPEFARESGLMIMRMNTAVAVTAAGLSLALWREAPGPLRARMAQSLGVLVAVIGGMTALQDVAGINLGIDQLLSSGTMSGDVAGRLVTHPGRMSLNAALSLLFLGLALTFLDSCARIFGKQVCFAPGLALVAALPATLGLVGYLLGVSSFTGLLRSTNILLHAAVVLFALSAGVLAARPKRAPVRRVLSPGPDGVLLRWTLPGTTGLLLTLGWMIGRGRDADVVAQGEGTALMLYGGLVLLSTLLVSASQVVARQENRARRASEALRRGQERSRAIVDTALDGVLLMNTAGTIADWNPAAERIFGWSREEVLGQPLAELIIPEELRAAHYRGLARLLETGEGPILGKRLELPALRRDGTRFPVELSINPLPGVDRALFVGFIRDITERQAAQENLRSAKEAAEAASRAKDNFFAALSHELRTPLAPVLLSASELRDDERLPADVREQMAMMERNIALEARLIDDLLDLTRITRGKLPIRAEPCDTHSLLSHAIDIVRDEARAKNIALDLTLTAERSGLVGDPGRLQQVFWNLLKNAVKFTPAGGRIAIKTHDDAENQRLVLEVTDTGVGFDPGAADRIFLPFEQAGREGDHRFGGLGLGLAIARAIVDLHGGVIRAESPGSGHGATFTVELPGAIAPPHGMLTAEPLHPGKHAQSAPLRILLVEDHEPTMAVLVRLLTRAGHQVIPAGTVAAGLAAAETASYDIVISDLGLPDGTGLELIAALRIRKPDLRAIALSGYGMEEDLIRTKEAGFVAHLVKPIDFEQLRRALRELKSVG
ncbi:MAG TPA: PAS domain S-box protein [Chthoniobacteraceae bacterium]|nr:PAS domain S-box protein [Chthoniobacteraceae bacterium]